MNRVRELKVLMVGHPPRGGFLNRIKKQMKIDGNSQLDDTILPQG